MKPRLTDKVRKGLWLIIARSPWVFDAENGCKVQDKEECEAIRAAARYADAHWKPKQVVEIGMD
jgi:hypothetical protein